MPEVNLNDRASIEAVYPLDDFKRDAGRNSVPNTPVLHGVRIMSEPDSDGRFEIVTAKRQTGERDPEGDTVFLPPFLRSDAAALTPGGSYAGPDEQGDAVAKTEAKDADYEAFIDRLVAAARRVDFKPPDGQDERLRGFRGG